MMARTPADKKIVSEVAPYKVGTRTDSAAMLAWFLEAIWRLDPAVVDDAICDGPGDKGIDALIIDEDLAEITVLQAKWIVDPSKTQVGDSSLKQLVGAGDYFKSAENVQGLLASGPNAELKKLLLRQDVLAEVAKGTYDVRLAFVTNGDLDKSATSYLSARTSLSPAIDTWDRNVLTASAQRTERPGLRPETHTLIASARPTVVKLGTGEKIAVAIVPATELVKLPGIEDMTLFGRNVRLAIARSTVNQGLKDSVANSDEHVLFPAYHNGLTVLTTKATERGTKIKLEQVGVVNGCQSLSTLFKNKDKITAELQLVVKVVEVPGDDAVSDRITYRSNNQNAVTMRDQRSGDRVMRDLRASVRSRYGNQFELVIKQGEAASAKDVLDNALAAQLIMAVALQEPWAAVRKVRLFDQDYRRIFNRKVTADSLRLLYLIDQAVSHARPELRPDLRSSFASVRFTLAHLVARVCALSDDGARLMDHPEDFLPAQENAVLAALKMIAEEVVSSVNFYVETQIDEREAKLEDDPDADLAEFDPKTVFKSQPGVRNLAREALNDARRTARRASSSYLFSVTPAAGTPVKKTVKKAPARKTVRRTVKKAPAKKTVTKAPTGG